MHEKIRSLEHGRAQNVAGMVSETCAKAVFGSDLEGFPYKMLKITLKILCWGFRLYAVHF